jgi:hypothetical protein
MMSIVEPNEKSITPEYESSWLIHPFYWKYMMIMCLFQTRRKKMVQ